MCGGRKRRAREAQAAAALMAARMGNMTLEHNQQPRAIGDSIAPAPSQSTRPPPYTVLNHDAAEEKDISSFDNIAEKATAPDTEYPAHYDNPVIPGKGMMAPIEQQQYVGSVQEAPLQMMGPNMAQPAVIGQPRNGCGGRSLGGCKADRRAMKYARKHQKYCKSAECWCRHASFGPVVAV